MLNRIQAAIATTLASLAIASVPATSQAQWNPDSGRQTWFAMPTCTQLRASAHRVFADYMPCFPLQIDNVDPDVDYYTRVYLNPEGYDGRWTNCGGFLRERPLPPSVDNTGNVNYQSDNYLTEIRRATNAGLDGFNFFYGDFNESTLARLDTMLDVAGQTSGFKIRFHPDMYDIDPTDAPNVYDALMRIKDEPALDRLPDGRIVVSPYLPDKNGLPFWQDMIARWKAAGLKIAFIPVFQGYHSKMPTWGSLCDGAINWGAEQSSTAAADKAKYGLEIYGNSVTPQVYRPKTMDFKESLGSHRYRVWWGKLIKNTSVDWVDVGMWNDYAESTEVAPSSRTGTAFYEVTAYYLTWFKTGTQPTILRDRLFAFQRSERYIPTDPILAALRSPLSVLNGDPIVDQVELVGFLKTPGTMTITNEDTGNVATMDAVAGINELRAPLDLGTYTYGLKRGTTLAARITSPFEVTNGGTVPDMLYNGISFSNVN